MSVRDGWRRRFPDGAAALALGFGVAALALATSGCASGSSTPSHTPQAEPVAVAAATTTTAQPAQPAAPPAASTPEPDTLANPAHQHAPARPLTDFQWPDPLPGCSAEVPALFKGLVIGTWTPEGESGFEEAWVDERGLREAWTKASSSRRTWRGFTVADPTVLVDSLLSDRTGPAVGYLFSLVARTGGGPDIEDAPAVVHVRHRGRLRAFFDGLPLLDLPAPAPGSWGEARAPVVLSSPYSVLLLKLGRGDASLGSSMDVEVRVSAPDGSPLPGQTWNTMRPGVLPAGG